MLVYSDYYMIIHGWKFVFFLQKKFYIVQALDIFCQKKSINEEKIWIHDWGKIKNYSQTYTLRFFVLIVHISPCVVSVMAAAAADFPSFPNPSTAADLYTEPSGLASLSRTYETGNINNNSQYQHH